MMSDGRWESSAYFRSNLSAVTFMTNIELQI